MWTGFELIRSLIKPADTKIVLLLLDGLGGIPGGPEGLTELEAAHTPNMDDLAADGICGLHEPVGPGITPGSGPSHLGVFGYDPLRFQVGRGVMSALGIDFALQPGDVAARGNFCTVDEDGIVTDRRAGRISSEKNRELCRLLREAQLSGVDYFVETVKEHRFVLVLRGRGLSSEVDDTDPQGTGRQPLDPKPQSKDAGKTARVVSEFIGHAKNVLSGSHPANMVILRGFSSRPRWPLFGEIYGLDAAAISAYPMYRGLARLLGMKVLETENSVEGEFNVLKKHWDDFDFFYLHIKYADSAGEDGDFGRKAAALEEADRQIPRLRELNPDVIVVTGDHSSPSVLGAHSWHPVPALIWSEHCRRDGVVRFGERACIAGGLGPRIHATDLMPIVMANAMRMRKFGA